MSADFYSVFPLIFEKTLVANSFCINNLDGGEDQPLRVLRASEEQFLFCLPRFGAVS